jgi:polysaccharide deacetylase 2 family uncharacterized protein YibQ
MSAAEFIKNNFSKKHFLSGLGMVAGVYMLIFLFLLLNSGKITQEMQDKQASLAVMIEHRNITIDPQQLEKTVQKPIPGTGIHSSKVQPRPGLEQYEDLKKLSNGMVISPVKGLSETTEFGKAPVKRKDGLTAFDAYRRPFDSSLIDAPLISIAVTNLGLSSSATEAAIKELPANVSFILSPYADSLDFWINESRAHGHEVWLTLPMETQKYPLHDPGPHTLLINATVKENKRKLAWSYSQAEGYIGFVTEQEPVFMNAYNDMRPIINELYNRGIGFVDGSSNPPLIPQSIALGMNAPYATIDVWLDTEPKAEEIEKQLKKLEELADDRGFATGVIHAYPVSFEQIQKWLIELEHRGYILAPLSAQTGL